MIARASENPAKAVFTDSHRIAEAVIAGSLALDDLANFNLDQRVVAKEILVATRRMRQLALSAGLDNLSGLMEQIFYASYPVAKGNDEVLPDF